MRVRKFNGENENTKITIRIMVDTVREKEMLTALFHNTYKLQELINSNTEERFEHDEVKHVADSIYIALVTNS